MSIRNALARTFESVIDAIVPLRARSARTKARTLADVPLAPAVHELLGTSITTLADYREPAVRDLIRSLKYDGSKYAAALAAGLVEGYLREEIAADAQFSTSRILLVPIPLHKTRARERGFNQIELALRFLPQELRDGTLSTLAPDVLLRTRATPQQTRLSRSARLSNVAGAFEVAPDISLKHTHVYLLDDVTTTGATLVNAATPLRRAGANVTLLALARA